MQEIAPRIWYWRRPHASSIYAVVMWNVGSRHDPPAKEGLMHFLEHSLFKGTEKSPGKSIFHRIERVGGELNAFTTKDKMGIEVRIAPNELSIALSVLYELAYEATFPDTEVEKEREVILEEMAMYEDIPEESLADHFEEQIFTQGGLRHPIIGYSDSVRSISSADLRNFYRENLRRSSFVFLLTGPLSEKDMLKYIHRSAWREVLGLGNLSAPLTAEEDIAPPTIRHVKRHTQQAHLIIGGLAPVIYDWEGSMPVQLLLHGLAGGMSSRLSLILREKYGWTYSIHGFYHSYSEKAVWGIYTGLSPESFNRARQIIRNELNRLIEKPISQRFLSELSRSFLGKQALVWESPTYRINVYGRSLLDIGRIVEEAEWREAVRALTPMRLSEAAAAVFGQLYEWAYIPEAV
ncbi:MAG: insulinase family protein [Bacteroidia bacterium]|nr:insulinase family protein [Bacteroidia bacterium]MDW8416220.1 pitrilysin family protein [Bacteroidia bacterium]